ncbi:MAG: hypothetical protein IKT98_07340 [Selenomonadaceae bacterium]|nr:hypothetical protein [Selenomonadaceae bacterium]
MEDERKAQFEQLYSFGVEWLGKIENDIRAQHEEIENLKADNANYERLQSALRQAMMSFDAGK